MMGSMYNTDLSRIATTTSPISSNGDPNSAISPSMQLEGMQYFHHTDSGMAPPKGSRARRKSSSGSEQVKHRRTRSGCFTCRTRRVKCDETHPICERCLKGSRECTYPEIPPPRTSNSSRKREKTVREESSSLDELEEEEEEDGSNDGTLDRNRLHPEVGTGPRVTRRASWTSNNERNRKFRPPNARKGSYDPAPSPSTTMTESFFGDSSSTPTSPAESAQLRHRSSVASLSSTPWAHLPNDIQFFLTFYKSRITCYHYLIKQDYTHFFKTTYLDYAVQCESLMYAVVAFAAFRASVTNRTTAFQTFVEYYDKAVSSLRASLATEPTVATLLTILQLASFEEYLGDWGNLLQHRNAAANVIVTLYTPQTLAATAEGRLIYSWFSRFDLYAAMMAGRVTTLSVDWSEVNRNALTMESNANPHCLELKAEVAHAKLRDLAFAVADLAALKSKDILDPQELEAKGIAMQADLLHWLQNLDPALSMSMATIKEQPLNAEDYCPFLPAEIYVGGAWTTNMLMCDYYGLKLMLVHQMTASHEGMEKVLSDYAIKICQIIGGMDVHQQNPAGWLLTVEASLALASIWVPPKQDYRAWVRKQLGQIEATGYIFPEAYRIRIAEIWNDPSLKICWSESSGISTIIRQIGDVRETEAQKDPVKDEVREMRAVLANLRIDTSDEQGSTPGAAESPESTFSTPSVATTGGGGVMRGGQQPVFRAVDGWS